MESGLLSRAEAKNYLYVEGDDDKQVFLHLLNYYNITHSEKRGIFISNNEKFEIKNNEGIDALLENLNVALKGNLASNRYGVVVDADGSLEDIWLPLKELLQRRGYDVPRSPHPSGTVLKQEGHPIVGIWIMPDNTSSGMIEDFICFLGPQKDKLWPIAEEVLQKVMDTQCNFIKPYRSKARLHTWLAWQEEPGRPMGLAITKRYVDAKANHAVELIGWFRRVFELGQS